MKSQAYFNNISEQIQNEIANAKHSVNIAVAWFTDVNLFNALKNKALQGCKVTIITSNDIINQQSKIDYLGVQIDNFKVYLYGDSKTDLIHHKFCVIDNHTVITGSYNWTNKAKFNQENIVITKDDNALVLQFKKAFNNLLLTIGVTINNKDFNNDIDAIIKRLEIIKNCILLNEFETLKPILDKLKGYQNLDLQTIDKLISKNNFETATQNINDFIVKHKNEQITLWVDKDLEKLKFELRTLEIQLSAYTNEKIDLEKQLLDFQFRHSKELGSIMSEILKYRKYNFLDDEEKYKEAEEDERQYNEQIEEEKQIQKFELNKEEKIILKKQFRKASMLCHPDKINDSMKDEAEKLFIDLKNAYDANDLEKVSEILQGLENNTLFKSKSETLTENDKLKASIASIKQHIKKLIDQILEIKNNETYITISEIEDIDNYFKDLKLSLQDDLEHLKANTIINPE